MKPQKDIGDLIREKVDRSQETLQTPLWASIKRTLLQNNKRRVLLDWCLNGLIILCSVLGLYAMTTVIDPNEKKSETPQAAPQSLAEETTQALEKPVLENSTITPKEIQAAANQKPTTYTINNARNSKTAITAESPQTQKIALIKDVPKGNETATQPALTENPAQRTEKVYYYYNSKDGQEVMSKNRAVIDSTWKANSIKRDSL